MKVGGYSVIIYDYFTLICKKKKKSKKLSPQKLFMMSSIYKKSQWKYRIIIIFTNGTKLPASRAYLIKKRHDVCI